MDIRQIGHFGLASFACNRCPQWTQIEKCPHGKITELIGFTKHILHVSSGFSSPLAHMDVNSATVIFIFLNAFVWSISVKPKRPVSKKKEEKSQKKTKEYHEECKVDRKIDSNKGSQNNQRTSEIW